MAAAAETGIVVRKDEGQQLAELERLTEGVRNFVGQSKAASTLRAYRTDWKDFSGWCEGIGLQALPASAETVARYLVDRAGSCKVATIQRRIASISKAHQAAGHPPPTKTPLVRDTLQGIQNAKGVAPAAKAPAILSELRRMVDAQPEGLQGIRNRALLLLGFAGAFRRSELVSLNREDVETTMEGLVVTLRRSKTDQKGEGRKIGIPYGSHPVTCPVRALGVWVDAAGIKTGPLFKAINRHGQIQPGRLTAQSVALVVKNAATAAGLDASKYAGHSLRSGLATSAAAAGAPERAIMEQTGHRSVMMVRRYVRHGSLFRENAAAYVGM